VIAASPELRLAILGSDPSNWSAIFERHRTERQGATAAYPALSIGTSIETQRRHYFYVSAILARELPRLAAMAPNSGRNQEAFRLVCRVGRWVHHGVISRDQLIAAVLEACERNGLVEEDGQGCVLPPSAAPLRCPPRIPCQICEGLLVGRTQRDHR
jgi:hypothetical protein